MGARGEWLPLDSPERHADEVPIIRPPAWRIAGRVTALTLVWVLSLFAFGAGLHPEDDLTGLNQVMQCAIASTSGHVTGMAAENVTFESPLTLTTDALAGTIQPDPAARPYSPDQGRPPSFLA